MVLGCRFQGDLIDVVYGTITLYGMTFQTISTINRFCNSPRDPNVSQNRSHDPGHTRRSALAHGPV